MTDPTPVTPKNSTIVRQLPPLATQWVKLVLGFSVSVAIGLAPYLGKLQVPLFTPILTLMPEEVQPIAIPLAAAAMGIVAVLVQWFGSVSVSHAQLSAWFARALVFCFVGLIALACVETLAVVRVDVPAVGRTVSFAVGMSSPNTPPCLGLSKAECIKTRLTLDSARIDTYFGEDNVNATKLVLVIVYTMFMSSFGALVGVFLLRREVSRRRDRDPKARSK